MIIFKKSLGKFELIISISKNIKKNIKENIIPKLRKKMFFFKTFKSNQRKIRE